MLMLWLIGVGVCVLLIHMWVFTGIDLCFQITIDYVIVLYKAFLSQAQITGMFLTLLLSV